MRPVTIAAAVVVGLAWTVAIVHGRLRLDPFAHARAAPRPRLVSAQIDPDAITTSGYAFGEVS